jgi:hypothetical protein
MANGPRAHDRRARRELFQKQRDICVPDGCKPDPGQLTGSRTAGSRAGAKAGGVRRRRHSHRNPTEGGRYAVRLGKGDTPTPRWYPLPSGRGAADSSFAARLARPRRLPPDTACRGMSGHGSLDPGMDGPRGFLVRFAEVVAARVPHPRRWRRDAFRGPVSRDRVGTGNGLFFYSALSQHSKRLELDLISLRERCTSVVCQCDSSSHSSSSVGCRIRVAPPLNLNERDRTGARS